MQVPQQFEDVLMQEAFEQGFERGYNAASWVDLPEIGSKVCTYSEGYIAVDADNQWDLVQTIASESEANARQYSPFEFIAHSFNESEDAEDLWEAFETGIAEGIEANVRRRHAGYI